MFEYELLRAGEGDILDSLVCTSGGLSVILVV
jgi:hypothetical protein